MDKKSPCSTQYTSRENILIFLLNKVIHEYKNLISISRKIKPLKIVEVLNLSEIAGETIFLIQISCKNALIKISAGEIIKNYNLEDFSDFHVEMIQHAVQGKLIPFLKLSNRTYYYNIVSKRFNHKIKQYLFTIEAHDCIRFTGTAEELSKNKNLLLNVDINDIYDIAYTHGLESILQEKAMLEKIKANNKNNL